MDRTVSPRHGRLGNSCFCGLYLRHLPHISSEKEGIRVRFAALIMLLGILEAGAVDVPEMLRLEPTPNMTRAEFHYVKTVRNPKAVLILCPGLNGNGESLVRSPKWIEFARKNKLGLVGLSFASPISAINNGTGYYFVST